MGLKDLDGMDIPDNKGGRPEKDEDEDQFSGREKEHAFNPNKDNPDWWLIRVRQRIDEDKLDSASFEKMMQVIGEVAEETHMNPIDVRKKLDEHEVYETDWERYREWELDTVAHGESPDSRVPLGPTPTPSNQQQEVSVFDDDDSSSGLKSLVGDKK